MQEKNETIQLASIFEIFWTSPVGIKGPVYAQEAVSYTHLTLPTSDLV